MVTEKKSLPLGVSVSLTSLSEDSGAVKYPVGVSPCFLGSSPDADVMISGKDVASLHARLVLEDDALFLEDLGEGTTTLNDRRARRARLQNGDIIGVGEVKLLLQLSIRSVSARPGENAGGGLKAKIWLGGFGDDTREWFASSLASEVGFIPAAFRTGEEIMTGLSRSLSSGEPPTLIILDLRMPLINGVNVAIAARGFELGFNHEDRIPIIFLFDPPEGTSFEKVIKFCHPVQVIRPGQTEDLNRQIIKQITAKVMAKI